MTDLRTSAIHHPAESELFDETLSCELALPAEFRIGSAVIRPGTAETLLRSVALVEDARGDDGHDDRSDATLQVQRLEAKLDLVMVLLGRLVRQSSQDLPLRPLRWSRRGIRLEQGARSGAAPGSMGVIRLQPCDWLPDHIDLSRLLQGFADVEVIAEASNAEQALQLSVQHSPDVVLMDLSLPGRTGLEALSDILLRTPGSRVVMMTMHDDAVHVRDALDRGAVGFVVKDAAPQELELALRAAHAGQVFLSPQISAKMLAPMLGKEKPVGVAALSPRQREILRQIGKGESNKEIAADLGISVKTVETHRARMMESLGCRRANDLVLLAARHQHELE